MSAGWNDPLVLLASSLPIVVDLFDCFNNSGKSTNHSSGWCLYPEMKNDNWNQLKPFWSRSLTHTHFFSRLGLPGTGKVPAFSPPKKWRSKPIYHSCIDWLVVYLPLWKMMEFVNGKDDMPYMKWNIKIHVWNHQFQWYLPIKNSDVHKCFLYGATRGYCQPLPIFTAMRINYPENEVPHGTPRLPLQATCRQLSPWKDHRLWINFLIFIHDFQTHPWNTMIGMTHANPYLIPIELDPQFINIILFGIYIQYIPLHTYISSIIFHHVPCISMYFVTFVQNHGPHEFISKRHAATATLQEFFLRDLVKIDWKTMEILWKCDGNVWVSIVFTCFYYQFWWVLNIPIRWKEELSTYITNWPRSMAKSSCFRPKKCGGPASRVRRFLFSFAPAKGSAETGCGATTGRMYSHLMKYI